VRVGGFQQMAGAGFVKLRMISAEMALRCIFTERGLTAPRRIASRCGISYYPRYETQTYSLTAIGLRLEQQVVVGGIFILPRTSTSPIVIGWPMPARQGIARRLQL
jgi:hypothetical protein